MTALEKYYNKFNEDHRLTTRHGRVEFTTAMKYIHDAIAALRRPAVKILDIGAGTGRYSLALSAEGYDVTAVELVKRLICTSCRADNSTSSCFSARSIIFPPKATASAPYPKRSA